MLSDVSPESFSILTLSSVLRANVNIYQKTAIGASPSVGETIRLETVLLWVSVKTNVVQTKDLMTQSVLYSPTSRSRQPTWLRKKSSSMRTLLLLTASTSATLNVPLPRLRRQPTPRRTTRPRPRLLRQLPPGSQEGWKKSQLPATRRARTPPGTGTGKPAAT